MFLTDVWLPNICCIRFSSLHIYILYIDICTVYIYIYYVNIYIYIWYPPSKVYLFHGQKEVPIYIYISFRCFGNLDFVLEGEEFDYKGRIEIANQRRGV